MKKYIVFSISFIILLVVFQFLSGYLMTLFYKPDMTNAWNQFGNLSNTVEIKGSTSLLPLILTFLAATMAYFSPRLFVKNNNK
ncbi:hypothetical protein [Sporosarcina ureae]|uniref:hypothetical protein n=1 Tax=Sporosarcina ureae TaxID=1571 RepID=UPI0009DC6091|nr:hypothetical protein [Sporosarcina ureae]ARF17832.1 hypothetical protein SporoP17a_11455 [Sporosarcina ureae]